MTKKFRDDLMFIWGKFWALCQPTGHLILWNRCSHSELVFETNTHYKILEKLVTCVAREQHATEILKRMFKKTTYCEQQIGVNFISCFASYAELLRHKIASQKLGVGIGCKCVEISMICTLRPTFMFRPLEVKILWPKNQQLTGSF